MKQSITIHPSQDLFNKTIDIPIDQINSGTFSQIGSSMLEILKDKGGIGLSANQVGLKFNMCVINVDEPIILINPRVLKQSDSMNDSYEGCLSLPGVTAKIRRHKTIVVKYEDVQGETKKLEAEGILSYCLQHELDHLKGVLMINRLTEYAKSKALKSLHKFKRYNGRDVT